MSPDSPSPLLADAVAPVPVAGVVPFSTVDWPGTLSATAFLQGCPWRCPYCHNPDLQAVRGGVMEGRGGPAPEGDPRSTPCRKDVGPAAHDLEWAAFLELLRGRRGLLDGVVFTGGEPTMHRGLGVAIDAVRGLGFGVGLHTSGSYPDALARILADHRPDWVGLDVKADPRDAEAYARVAYGGGDFGRAGSERAGFAPARLAAGGKVLRSLRLVIDSGVDLEVRTTVWPDSPAAASVPGIAAMLTELAGATVRPGSAEPAESAESAESAAQPRLTWAIQKARRDGVSPDAAAAANFRADRPGWTAGYDRLIADARASVPSGTVRVLAR